MFVRKTQVLLSPQIAWALDSCSSGTPGSTRTQGPPEVRGAEVAFSTEQARPRGFSPGAGGFAHRPAQRNPTWDQFKTIALTTAFCHSVLPLPRALNPGLSTKQHKSLQAHLRSLV